MPTTTSFNVENIWLKDRFSMIQLEVFIILKVMLFFYGNKNWSSEANMVSFRAAHWYIHAQTLLNNIL